jgi:DNA-3-methyladenine glycosylase
MESATHLRRKVPRAFYDRDTVAVARELLGKYLVHVSRGVERVGRIVEVEAYGPHDLASHLRGG